MQAHDCAEAAESGHLPAWSGLLSLAAVAVGYFSPVPLVGAETPFPPEGAEDPPPLFFTGLPPGGDCDDADAARDQDAEEASQAPGGGRLLLDLVLQAHAVLAALPGGACRMGWPGKGRQLLRVRGLPCSSKAGWHPGQHCLLHSPACRNET